LVEDEALQGTHGTFFATAFENMMKWEDMQWLWNGQFANSCINKFNQR
jgi:hypothetical protein